MIRVLSAILLLLIGVSSVRADEKNVVLPVHHYVYLPASFDTTAPRKLDTVPKAPLRLQADTSALLKTDTVKKKKHNPRTATIRSAIIPGWGQIYNKKYWKLPIVYAAIGIPAYLFVDNKKWYDRIRYGLSIVANERYGNADSMSKVHPRVLPLVERKSSSALMNYRNEYRKNMDYSILVGLLFWGLQIVDATVDAHLKDFDISDNISLNITPAILPGNSVGLSFVFNLGANNRAKGLPSLR